MCQVLKLFLFYGHINYFFLTMIWSQVPQKHDKTKHKTKSL